MKPKTVVIIILIILLLAFFIFVTYSYCHKSPKKESFVNTQTCLKLSSDEISTATKICNNFSGIEATNCTNMITAAACPLENNIAKNAQLVDGSHKKSQADLKRNLLVIVCLYGIIQMNLLYLLHYMNGSINNFKHTIPQTV